MVATGKYIYNYMYTLDYHYENYICGGIRIIREQ